MVDIYHGRSLRIEDDRERAILYSIGVSEASFAICCSLSIIYTYFRFKVRRVHLFTWFVSMVVIHISWCFA